MTEIRTPVGIALAPAARQTTDAVREAQRVFFQAALGQAPTPQATLRSDSVVTAQTTPLRPAAASSAASTSRIDPQTPPNRLLRPGSIVDIKV